MRFILVTSVQPPLGIDVSANMDTQLVWKSDNAPGESRVWETALLPHNQDGKCLLGALKKVRCAVCLQEIKLNDNLSTSNILQHGRSEHPLRFASLTTGMH